MQKSRTKNKSEQQNQTDSGESAISNELELAVICSGAWAVTTGMQKSMPEGPVLREIVPAVVLLFPAGMTEAPHQRCRERLCVQGSDPEPFMLRGFGCELPASVML